jgi:hypothetical protein
MTTTHRLMLGDLIQAVSAVSASDYEVLATLSHLVNSGRVQVGKTSTRARIDALPRIRKVTGLVLHK